MTWCFSSFLHLLGFWCSLFWCVLGGSGFLLVRVFCLCWFMLVTILGFLVFRKNHLLVVLVCGFACFSLAVQRRPCVRVRTPRPCLVVLLVCVPFGLFVCTVRRRPGLCCFVRLFFVLRARNPVLILRLLMRLGSPLLFLGAGLRLSWRIVVCRLRLFVFLVGGSVPVIFVCSWLLFGYGLNFAWGVCPPCLPLVYSFWCFFVPFFCILC